MISFTRDQTFIVTGASSGIGAGVALLLNELGARVVAIARNEQRLNEVKARCKNPDLFAIEIKDLVEDVAVLPSYVKELRAKYGKFSGMAYCAGVTANRPLQLLEYEQSISLFDIDYFAPILMAKGLADKRNCVGRGTSMVFISSLAAIASSRAMIEYTGAKAALCQSVRSMAKELAPHGIRVNSVLPSDIETPMTLADPDILYGKTDRYPMGIGKVRDVANVVAFLLSADASWIAGQQYVVDCASL